MQMEQATTAKGGGQTASGRLGVIGVALDQIWRRDGLVLGCRDPTEKGQVNLAHHGTFVEGSELLLLPVRLPLPFQVGETFLYRLQCLQDVLGGLYEFHLLGLDCP